MKPGVGLKLAYGIIVACGLIVAITVVVPSDATKADVALTFTPAEIDLTGGSTIFAEQDVTARVRLRNDSDHPLVVEELSSSCSCAHMRTPDASLLFSILAATSFGADVGADVAGQVADRGLSGDQVSSTANEDLLSIVLEANSATLAALHSFHVTVEAHGIPVEVYRQISEHPESKPPTELTLFKTFEWFRDGDKERIHRRDVINPVDDKGLPSGMEDVYRDGTLQYTLGNWDWGDPQPMSPAHQGSVYASIERQSTTYHNIDPAWFLQLYPRFVVSEPRLPLADYVKGFARCEVLDSKGESDFRIRLREPRATEFYEPDDIIDVVLSSKHGYLIREIVRSFRAAGDQRVEYRYEVTSFHDAGAGTFFPKTVEYTISSTRPDPDNEYRVTIHSINEPLPEEDFDFRFPKDVQVVDTTQGVEDHKWLLWGADNKPAMEISSPADLLRVDPGGANAGRSQTSARFIAINAALLVLIVLVICIVRRKHRS